MSEVTRAGLAEMRRSPGLVAAVDQHGAAIRDMLVIDARGVRRASLLDYLHGFLAGAAERGWRPGIGRFHGWEDVRLLAVCCLTRRA